MDNLKTLKAGAQEQIAEINVELSYLIAAGLSHGARATSLAAQRSKLLNAVRELDDAIRRAEANNLGGRMGNG